ncbi:MAG TPA: hypothetical protein VN857_02740 [Chthoniobacterales bacterium]|jgi:hypothetical protein|nr:hypothetical protein [Chthoniobacterales bacterium]
MIVGRTRGPRNVDSLRAAAILYGDWGTSKAYVIGLTFSLAGYSSFWLIAAMCFLLVLVAINYMIICRYYPDGGGVYASVHHRSRTIAIIVVTFFDDFSSNFMTKHHTGWSSRASAYHMLITPTNIG